MRCLAARVNYKTLIIICALFTLVTVLLWNKCSSDKAIHFPRHLSHLENLVGKGALEKREFDSEDDNDLANLLRGGKPAAKQPSADAFHQEQQRAPPVASILNNNANKLLSIKYEEMDCLINDDYTIKGRKEGNEVYLPFNWIEKYFEVYGKIAQYDGYERFEFSHSYSKVYTPRGTYRPDGVFMSFEGYNVEVRDRVKCISGIEGRFCFRKLPVIIFPTYQMVPQTIFDSRFPVLTSRGFYVLTWLLATMRGFISVLCYQQNSSTDRFMHIFFDRANYKFEGKCYIYILQCFNLKNI